MLFKEIIGVYSEEHNTKLVNTLYGQNAVLLNLKTGLAKCSLKLRSVVLFAVKVQRSRYAMQAPRARGCIVP